MNYEGTTAAKIEMITVENEGIIQKILQDNFEVNGQCFKITGPQIQNNSISCSYFTYNFKGKN
jgi:hypothetical protein